ncbi:MAG: hypothetical protein JWN98_2369, partial [Abditibacteriota bacterium]|nr:hypothetical protein [Abditibacteriota bacterium]
MAHAQQKTQPEMGAPQFAKARPVHIALVSDTHTTRGTNEDQALYKGRLDQVIASVNAAKPDLVLLAGDLTQDGKAQEYADFRAQVASFAAPMLWIAGNHDVGSKRIEGKEGGVTTERVARYEAAMGSSFFLDVRSGVRIVGLNASLLGSGLPREVEQWTFLETVLDRPGALPTLLLMHNPPFLKTPTEPGGDYWNIEPEPRARLLKLLERGGVRIVLSGHLHRSIVNRHNNILFVTGIPVSFGLPRPIA